MILLDTSVLVRYLRAPSPAVRQIFSTAECALCGVTRSEILHGARTPEDSAHLVKAMAPFIPLPTPEGIWDELGHNLATLRSRGLPLPFQDVLLATLAIGHGADLWSYDGHFAMIRQVLPTLHLFAGPNA